MIRKNQFSRPQKVVWSHSGWFTSTGGTIDPGSTPWSPIPVAISSPELNKGPRARLYLTPGRFADPYLTNRITYQVRGRCEHHTPHFFNFKLLTSQRSDCIALAASCARMGADGSRLYSPSEDSGGYLTYPATPSPSSPGDKFKTLDKRTTFTTIDISLRSKLDPSQMFAVSAVKVLYVAQHNSMTHSVWQLPLHNV